MIERQVKSFDYKFYLFLDKYNQNRSKELFEAVQLEFNIVENISDATAVIVIGGDGTLLKVARDSSLNKLPILAINGGTVGKNLIDVSSDDIPELQQKIINNECKLLDFPMIEVNVVDENSINHTFHAFNDIFIDRFHAHTVKYSAQINSVGEDPIHITHSPISGDGILVSTPVGSTGYARMISEMILPLNQESLLICPMASMVLETKKKVHGFALTKEQDLNVQFKDTDFRPARIALDGIYINDSNGELLFVKDATFRLASDSHKITLISPSKNNFISKQMDFIAR